MKARVLTCMIMYIQCKVNSFSNTSNVQTASAGAARGLAQDQSDLQPETGEFSWCLAHNPKTKLLIKPSRTPKKGTKVTNLQAFRGFAMQAGWADGPRTFAHAQTYSVVFVCVMRSDSPVGLICLWIQTCIFGVHKRSARQLFEHVVASSRTRLPSIPIPRFARQQWCDGATVTTFPSIIWTRVTRLVC